MFSFVVVMLFFQRSDNVLNIFDKNLKMVVKTCQLL